MGIAARRRRPTTPTPTASTRRCWPGCSRTSGCSRTDRRTRPRSTSAPAAPGSRSSPARRCSGSNPQLRDGRPSSSRPSRLWARHERRDRAGVGRARSAQHLVKRTYSEPHWSKKRGGRDGPRAGHAVRRAARRRPHGQLRPDRPGAVAASCSSGTRWSRATGTPATSSSHDNRRLLEEAEELEHRARRRDIVVDERDAVRLLRRADRRRGRVSGAHFDTLVEAGAARRSPTCSTFDPAMLTHDARRRGAPRPTTRDAVAGRGDADASRSATTSSRAPPTTASPSTSRSRRSTRSTPTTFSWHVPGLREELVTALIRSRCRRTCGSTSCPRPTRPREFLAAVPRRARSRCSTRWSATCARTTGVRRAARGVGLGEGARRTCGRRSGSSTTPAPSRPAGKDLEALKAAAAAAVRRRRMAEVAADAGVARPAQTTLDASATIDAVVHPDAGPATRCAASRRWSTRAPRSGCGCSAPPTRRRRRHRLGVAPAAAAGAAVAGRALLDGLDNAAKLGAGRVAVPDRRRARSTTARPRSPAARRRARRRCATRRRTTRCSRDARAVRRRSARPRCVADVLRVLAALARRPTKRSAAGPRCACCRRCTDMQAQLGAAGPPRLRRPRPGAAQLRRYPRTSPPSTHAPRAARPSQVGRDRQLMDQVADAPGGLPAPGRRAARRAARPAAALRAGAVDARGVPRLALGPAARHRPAGQRRADPQGAGSTRSRGSGAPRPPETTASNVASVHRRTLPAYAGPGQPQEPVEPHLAGRPLAVPLRRCRRPSSARPYRASSSASRRGPAGQLQTRAARRRRRPTTSTGRSLPWAGSSS